MIIFLLFLNFFLCILNSMATKRTYQPKKLKRVRKHGFLKKMASHDGRKVIKRRRLQGRKKLTL